MAYYCTLVLQTSENILYGFICFLLLSFHDGKTETIVPRVPLFIFLFTKKKKNAIIYLQRTQNTFCFEVLTAEHYTILKALENLKWLATRFLLAFKTFIL